MAKSTKGRSEQGRFLEGISPKAHQPGRILIKCSEQAMIMCQVKKCDNNNLEETVRRLLFPRW